ncbi:MAG: CPBP family intramembrane metalloprotease [Chloroflexia bacterium]|nr:CPBP family intramembrane metalloprotease [Chloroflexia bacterium]
MPSPLYQKEASGFRNPLIEALVGYGGFCALGLASRLLPAAFVLFVAYGIVFPLVWARLTHGYRALGFSRRKLGTAVTWGLGVGIAWAIYTYVCFRQHGPMPPLWGLQVVISVPVWLLVLSPFQEIFFRGWLQPRLEAVAGRWGGLAVAAMLFTMWHFFPQLEGTATVTLPLSTPLGVGSTLIAGLLFGYIYQRTENIVAPWLAHAIGGIGLVLIGEMIFIQYVP